MPHIETVIAIEPYRERCEDRVAVFASDERTVIVAADGAGGLSSGDVAAESVLREVGAELHRVHSANQWAEVLRQIDCRISAGESTAVVVDVRPFGIAGASVGDSEAWVINAGETIDLTANQHRKPLLGSGAVSPVPFYGMPLEGVLLVATDGFCNYVKRDRVPAVIAECEFFAIPRRCIEMVRLPSGDLWDDIGIVAARIAPQHRTRKRYSI